MTKFHSMVLKDMGRLDAWAQTNWSDSKLQVEHEAFGHLESVLRGHDDPADDWLGDGTNSDAWAAWAAEALCRDGMTSRHWETLRDLWPIAREWRLGVSDVLDRIVAHWDQAVLRVWRAQRGLDCREALLV